MERLNPRAERKLHKKTGKVAVGMDEAGRGPIAGPVAVGVVLADIGFLKKNLKRSDWWRKVKDSKKLTPATREELYRAIRKKLPCGVGMASARYIDLHGIKKAIAQAAKEALRDLGVKPGIILQDGNQEFLKIKKCSLRKIIRGDGRLWSIACASILAKVSRDHYMERLSQRHPQYKFNKHKGYGTKLHFELLAKHGPSRHHRFSFAPLKRKGHQKSFGKNRPENAGR